MLDAIQLDAIREEFPILHQQVNGYPLVYFDNAATTQKPLQVIESLDRYYRTINSNVHRGAHTLADTATREFEETRLQAQRFLNAAHLEEVIFVKGVTDAINLVASTWGRKNLGQGDEILISAMEHHANIVPWQMLCQEKGCVLKVAPINDHGELMMEEFDRLLSSGKVKLVAMAHVSNALGTINPVSEIIAKAHAAGALVLLDGAQSTAHMETDVQALGCDFFALSAHKVYGPTGIGILYGRKELLEAMPPYQGGGEMIKEVTFEGTTYNDPPFKFEAGTPNIADVIALRHAFTFVECIGKRTIAAHEHDLMVYATEQMAQIPGMRFIGTAKEKVGVISFLIEGMHPYDIGMMLDARGIAVRTGHHCTQPLMRRFGIEGTARASFAVYNTPQEVDRMVEALGRIVKLFG